MSPDTCVLKSCFIHRELPALLALLLKWLDLVPRGASEAANGPLWWVGWSSGCCVFFVFTCYSDHGQNHSVHFSPWYLIGSSQQDCEEGISSFIWQLRKLRLREVEWPSQLVWQLESSPFGSDCIVLVNTSELLPQYSHPDAVEHHPLTPVFRNGQLSKQ